MWWRCSRHAKHEWQAEVWNRGKGTGCPFCANRRVDPQLNSLAKVAPRIAAEWHPQKNGKLRPTDVTSGSDRRVWWQCQAGHDHVWRTSIYCRTTGGTNCPFCAGQRVSTTNCLATARPDVIDEWHPTRNGDLTPWQVNAGTHRHVWWRCRKDPRHEWKTEPKARYGCPFCSHARTPADESLARLRPRIAKQWHPARNGDLCPKDVVPGSNRRVWWKCTAGPDHEWAATVISRTFVKTGCPFCGGKRLSVTNSLAAVAPKLVKEWDFDRNGALVPKDIRANASREVFWICPNGPDHRWKATVRSRAIEGVRCPFCTNKRLSITNCLATKYPKIAAQWHPSLNRKLTPYQVFPYAEKKVWWRCDLGHEWRALICSRVMKSGGCSICRYTGRRRKQAMTWKPRKAIRFPSDTA